MNQQGKNAAPLTWGQYWRLVSATSREWGRRTPTVLRHGAQRFRTQRGFRILVLGLVAGLIPAWNYPSATMQQIANAITLIAVACIGFTFVAMAFSFIRNGHGNGNRR